MRKSLMGALVVVSNFVYAQEKKDALSFDFGYSINSYSMGKLNEFYIDSFAFQPNINLLQNKITKGQQYRLGLNYQPTGLFDIGIFGSYQFGNSTSNPLITQTDDWGFPIQEHRGNFELRTEAFGVGVSTTWYITHLLKFQEKENTLNRLHIGIELNAGVGYSKAILDLRFETLSFASYNDFNSRDFQGQAGLKVEYDFTKNPIFTTLGIRAGYQYFRTRTIKDRLDKEWVVLDTYPINLDFSGLYLGAYLKFGK
jgi:hypothetical protein